MSKSASRSILLTGATRGLGRAMLDGFIELGHAVWACGRSRSGVTELKKVYGAPHDFDALDVADDRAVSAWATRAAQAGFVPDLLINNAAVVNDNAPLWEVQAEAFSHVIDVNIKGVANVIRHFAPAMIERRRGMIVNFSSGWGRSTSPEVAPYCATKWAIEGLSQALSQELPEGMAAVALNPGIIDTDMLRRCFGKEAGNNISPQIWARRAVPYLLSLGPRENGRPLTVPGQD